MIAHGDVGKWCRIMGDDIEETRRLADKIAILPGAKAAGKETKPYEPEDMWWCTECQSFVGEMHRCEQWSQTLRIPAEAIAELIAIDRRL